MAHAELNADGSAIIIKCDLAENHLAEQVPGCNWRERDQSWHLPLSWPGCLCLREIFGYGITIGERLQLWGWEYRLKAGDRLRWQSKLDVNEFEWAYAHEHVPNDQTLFPFQAAGAIWLSLADSSLLADDMGSGKTIQAAVSTRLDGTEHQDGVVLVICPAPGRQMWRREIEKWAPHWQPVVVNGSLAARRQQILDAAPGQVLIISWPSLASHTKVAHYAGVRRKMCPACGGPRDPVTGDAMFTDAKCEAHRRELNNVPLALVISDEAHRAKDPHSKQARAWWAVSRQAARRIAITGTPIESSIGDLWSILHGLDPIAFPGRSRFLDLFATMSRNYFGGAEILGLNPDHRDLFYQILNLYMRRLPKELVLPQLPPKLPPVYRYAEMGAQQRREYEQMTKDRLLHLDEILYAKNPLAKLTHQLGLASACGDIRNVPCRECKGAGQDEFFTCMVCEGTGIHQELHLQEPSCAIDDLMDFLQDYGSKPLVVFAVRRELLELASKRLAKAKITHVMYTGMQNDMQKNLNWQAFQGGRVQLILVTFGAGAELVTFTASDTIFFMERHPSFLKNKQAEDRVHRIGSEGHDAISYVISLTAGTVKERVAQLYEEKGERFEEVVRDKAMMRWLISGE